MRNLIVFCLVVVAGLCARPESYVFSADGVTVGSAPRDLPSQGFDRATGRVVVGLGMRTDAEKAACGWWRVVPTPQPGIVLSNEYWTASGYTFTNNVAYQGWVKRWRKVMPRRFSKLKVVAALTQAGVWPQVKTWIEQNGLYDLYLAAQDFAEDNTYFNTGKAQLQAALGWSDEQIEALLKECILR